MENKNKQERRRGPMGPMGGMPFEKPKNFKASFKSLMNYLAVFRLKIILVAIFALGSTVFSIVGPKLLGNATQLVFSGMVEKMKGVGGINFAEIGKVLLLLITLYVISFIFSLIQGFTMTGVAQKMTYNLRNDISKKIHKLPMNYFDTKSHGEILSRITNDVDTLGQSLNQSLTQIITSLCTMAGVLFMMLTISFQMTLVALLIMPVALAIVGVIVKNSQKYFKAQQKTLGKVNGQVEETFSGLEIVRLFNADERIIHTFKEENKKLYTSAWKSQFLSGIMQPIMAFVGNIGYVAVSVVGGYLAVIGSINVGNILSFIQYTRIFNQPIAQIASISALLQSTMAAWERVYEFLNEAEEEKSPANPVSKEGLSGSVDFKGVNFGYNKEQIIIKNFSTSVAEGQKVAIVGPTGAGKTTIVKLLMRFYDVNGGKISIDGKDIRDFDRTTLRSMFGMVLQDTWLFNGTIMENIRYAKQDATDQEVYEAAKAAHAHRFIKTLPEGYNMVINEEASNISQGQKQLLTIARAILADPKILILDEATSSVDTRTEARIQMAMDNLMHGRTSFVIAHRLSTIKNANVILVMNDGDIVEQGSHDELLTKDGFYSKLYNSQFQTIE